MGESNCSERLARERKNAAAYRDLCVECGRHTWVVMCLAKNCLAKETGARWVCAHCLEPHYTLHQLAGLKCPASDSDMRWAVLELAEGGL